MQCCTWFVGGIFWPQSLSLFTFWSFSWCVDPSELPGVAVRPAGWTDCFEELTNLAWFVLATNSGSTAPLPCAAQTPGSRSPPQGRACLLHPLCLCSPPGKQEEEQSSASPQAGPLGKPGRCRASPEVPQVGTHSGHCKHCLWRHTGFLNVK